MFRNNHRWPIVGVVFCAAVFASSSVFAQEGDDAGAKVTDQIQAAGAGFVTRLREAIQGNTVAAKSLMDEFVLPAAIALIFMIVGYLVAAFIGRVIGNTISKRVDKTLGRFAGRMIRNMLVIMVLVGALGYFGVDVTSFAAILAAAGFAVGMALQGTLGNFAAGVMLLVFRPFKIDDYVKVGDCEGTVEEIELFTTQLNTPDNRRLIIPNGKIYGETMVHYNKNDLRRVGVDVGTAYSADLKNTRQVLENAIAKIEGAEESPQPQVYLSQLGDSAIHWQCRVWCKPAEFWAVRERVTETVKVALDEAEIGIPYPQMDINVVGKVLAKAAA